MEGVGIRSEIGELKRVLVKRPEQAFVSRAKLESEWKRLGYLECPDFSKAIREYEHVLAILAGQSELIFSSQDDSLSIDSIYVRDASVATDRGAILCSMGKPDRVGEPASQMKVFIDAAIPVLGSIRVPGFLEGGDVVWINRHTLAVGRGYRTNSRGIEQLKRLVDDSDLEWLVVDLPHWKGPGDVFHLMSILSPLDTDKLLVYSRLFPVSIRNRLLEAGLRLIEVPDEEFESMACNVLALAPGRVLALAGNPLTRRRLEQAGVEVLEYVGDEISRKGQGGPTCLTRPLLRAPVPAN